MTDDRLEAFVVVDDDTLAQESQMPSLIGAMSEQTRSHGMQVAIPNEYGVLAASHTEVVARLGRSYAAVDFALCEDDRYRYSVRVMYSYGGFGGPISTDSESFVDMPSAKHAGMEELRRRWPKPFASDPRSVHEELRLMREQVEGQLRQPSLF